MLRLLAHLMPGDELLAQMGPADMDLARRSALGIFARRWRALETSEPVVVNRDGIGSCGQYACTTRGCMAAMAAGEQVALVEGLWRATDLTWAYLDQDRAQVGACLEGLDSLQVEHPLVCQVLEHDMLSGDLGEPSMSAAVLDEVAALAPVDCEFVMTTAMREGVAAGMGLSSRLQEFAGGGAGPRAAGAHGPDAPGGPRASRRDGVVVASAEDYVRRGFPRRHPAT